MGLSMAECGAGGGLVWVLRKNGTWWPGRIVGPNEISCSYYRNKNGGIPVKLLGKPDASVDWFNLEKSKRIKAFRCGEFNDCIARAESSQGRSIHSLKYVSRADAILHALQLEKQEVIKGHKRPGEEFQGAVCRAKRSRRVYLPIKSSNCSCTISDHQSSILHPHKIVHESPVQSGSTGRNTSSRSRGCKSFAGDFRNREKEKSVKQASDQTAGFVQAHKRNVQGKTKVDISRKLPVAAVDIRKDIQEKLLIDCSFEVQRNTKSTPKSGKREVVIRQSQSSLQGQGSLNSQEAILIDIEVAVETSYREEYVPWVSLMSRFNGCAIIGHPIDIETTDISSTKPQPVWRTSRRTPVSYLPLPPKPVEKVSPQETEFLLKPLKKRELPNEYRVSGPHFKSPLKSCIKKGGLLKSTTHVTCVPVKLVFSKLHEAFGCLQS